jgi:hypothetical protein
MQASQKERHLPLFLFAQFQSEHTAECLPSARILEPDQAYCSVGQITSDL